LRERSGMTPDDAGTDRHSEACVRTMKLPVQSDFQIEIASQGWLPSAPGYDPLAQDLCTHGQIDLVIGGEVIAASGGDVSYGISEAALALLRTLSAEHSPRTRVADRLIPHGCGTILMMGCPIGIDWSVAHVGAAVRLDDVVRYETTHDGDAIRLPGLSVVVSRDDYRDEVVSFASKAKEPFAGVEKVFSDEFDQDQYESFWDEYERLLTDAQV
jgi:hypothetical protein